MSLAVFIFMSKTFEDIWNSAEDISSKLNINDIEAVIIGLQQRVAKLSEFATLPKEQAVNLGEILFDLATICKITEHLNDNIGVNVAAGLSLAIENRKAAFFDD